MDIHSQAQVLDFESARVREVVGGLSGTTVFICGSINAKNRLGGYVGWRRFMFIGSRLMADAAEPTSPAEIETAAALDVVCGDGGALESGRLNDAYTSADYWTPLLSHGQK